MRIFFPPVLKDIWLRLEGDIRCDEWVNDQNVKLEVILVKLINYTVREMLRHSYFDEYTSLLAPRNASSLYSDILQTDCRM